MWLEVGTISQWSPSQPSKKVYRIVCVHLIYSLAYPSGRQWFILHLHFFTPFFRCDYIKERKIWVSAAVNKNFHPLKTVSVQILFQIMIFNIIVIIIIIQVRFSDSLWWRAKPQNVSFLMLWWNLILINLFDSKFFCFTSMAMQLHSFLGN